MNVLVCGGRNYADKTRVFSVLDALHKDYTLTCVIHGNASGADSLADHWAAINGVQPVRCPAQWEYRGREAGPMRNRAMLTLEPRMVVAFPGGAGTAHMVRIAKRAGIHVMELQQ